MNEWFLCIDGLGFEYRGNDRRRRNREGPSLSSSFLKIWTHSDKDETPQPTPRGEKEEEKRKKAGKRGIE